jgi:hypothetical protein
MDNAPRLFISSPREMQRRAEMFEFRFRGASGLALSIYKRLAASDIKTILRFFDD